MRLLYNEEALHDVVNVLGFINNYTLGLGVHKVDIEPQLVEKAVALSRSNFPHNGGIDRASGFKQAAFFVCNFVWVKPIPESFPKHNIGSDLHKIQNHQNAMVALAIGEAAINNSTISTPTGEVVVKNPIRYSRHSYIDLIDALSTCNPASFQLVSVLLEQLAYKSNPEIQYPFPDIDDTCP